MKQLSVCLQVMLDWRISTQWHANDQDPLSLVASKAHDDMCAPGQLLLATWEPGSTQSLPSQDVVILGSRTRSGEASLQTVGDVSTAEPLYSSGLPALCQWVLPTAAQHSVLAL